MSSAPPRRTFDRNGTTLPHVRRASQNGQSVFDPRVRVVTYPVEIANFEVAVTVS